MSSLEIHSLTKHFGSRVVFSNLCFSLSRGDKLLITGPNGSGKTTFLSVLAGVLRPTGGKVFLNRKSPHQHTEIRMEIGFVSHSPLLYSSLTGYQNIHFFAGLYGVSTKVGCELAECLGVLPFLHLPVSSYSRGMQQKLSIVRALLHSPWLLLLDEPTNHLDETGIRNFCELIDSFTDRIIIVASHQPILFAEWNSFSFS